MGNNIRSPRPVYFKHGVIVFYVKDEIVHYIVKLWRDEGFKQYPIEEGVLGTQNITDIISKITQQFHEMVV